MNGEQTPFFRRKCFTLSTEIPTRTVGVNDLKKVGQMSLDKAWAPLPYPLQASEKSKFRLGGPTLQSLYLFGYWDLGEVSIHFSIPFMVYSKLRASLRTYGAIKI